MTAVRACGGDTRRGTVDRALGPGSSFSTRFYTSRRGFLTHYYLL